MSYNETAFAIAFSIVGGGLLIGLTALTIFTYHYEIQRFLVRRRLLILPRQRLPLHYVRPYTTAAPPSEQTLTHRTSQYHTPRSSEEFPANRQEPPRQPTPGPSQVDNQQPLHDSVEEELRPSLATQELGRDLRTTFRSPEPDQPHPDSPVIPE